MGRIWYTARKEGAVSIGIVQERAHWLVTGAAGFIGSNIVEALLVNGQTVVGLDNFSTGHRENLKLIQRAIGANAWSRFRFIEGDIRDLDVCREACRGARYVLHQAALGSVPLSIKDPVTTTAVNVDGFVNILVAAKEARVSRVVYASSSAVYGDAPELPKIEDHIGKSLSPYATTKRSNELYADAFGSCYAMEIIGLRYFNIFGPRQDPEGAYAAVIPKWFGAFLSDDTVRINGDGEISRDFCFVDNAVQANLLAALSRNPVAPGNVFNVACGQRITLNELFRIIRDLVATHFPQAAGRQPEYGPERAGDIHHSLADVSRARDVLGYLPTVAVQEGLQRVADWYWTHWGAQKGHVPQ